MTKLTESKRQEKIEAIDILTGIINSQQLLLKKVDEDNFDEFYSGSKIVPNIWKANYMAEISSGIDFLRKSVDELKYK